jgi:hypothetical protein
MVKLSNLQKLSTSWVNQTQGLNEREREIRRTRREERARKDKEKKQEMIQFWISRFQLEILSSFALLGFEHIYVETKKAWIYSKKKNVRASEVCDFFSENVPKINKKSDFYDMNTKYPFHRVKLLAFPKKESGDNSESWSKTKKYKK